MSFGLRGVIGVEGEPCTGGNSSLIHQGLPAGRIQAELRRAGAAHCRLTFKVYKAAMPGEGSA